MYLENEKRKMRERQRDAERQRHERKSVRLLVYTFVFLSHELNAWRRTIEWEGEKKRRKNSTASILVSVNWKRHYGCHQQHTKTRTMLERDRRWRRRRRRRRRRRTSRRTSIGE
jgi:hypothetical protein